NGNAIDQNVDIGGRRPGIINSGERGREVVGPHAGRREAVNAILAVRAGVEPCLAGLIGDGTKIGYRVAGIVRDIGWQEVCIRTYEVNAPRVAGEWIQSERGNIRGGAWRQLTVAPGPVRILRHGEIGSIVVDRPSV